MDSISIKPPCGPDCFSHISTIQSSLMNASKDYGIKMQNVETKSTDGHWYGQDITLYHLLQPIYGNNHCIIADILQTKTCKEVRTYVCVQNILSYIVTAFLEKRYVLF